jgi:soluble lytic murein transglycosylase-like protein
MAPPYKILAVLCAVAALLGTPGRSGHAEPAPSSCQDAASAAERRWGIPAQLLFAIGMQESGFLPWTFNAEGRGVFAGSKAAAVLQVQALQAAGMQSIDIGCFQINLAAHPLAFASLDDAFDPMTNGDYAGRFLAALHERTGSWPAAVAAYHSATPLLGEAYRQQVFAAWRGPDLLSTGPRMMPLAGTMRLASFRSVVAVWGPAGRLDAGMALAGAGARQKFGLPRVITPGSGR